MQDAGQRVGIVRRKLRIQSIARRERQSCTGQIRHIGMFLARKHRIACKTLLLRNFNLGIPVRSLHESYGNAASAIHGQTGDEPQHLSGSPRIGLHGQTESLVTGQTTVPVYLLEDLQRDLETVGFLGIDGQSDA